MTVKQKLNKCYNKSVPSIWGYIMNFIRNTILTLVLLTPIIVLATSEMRADDLEEVGVEQTIVEEIIDEVQPDEVIQEPVKAELQKVFGDDWKLAYAVVMSEGGLNPKQKSHKSYWCESLGRQAWDYGIFQISECWHPDVLYECATDIQCATKEAYRISKGGTDWTPWYGYTKGGYLKHL